MGAPVLRWQTKVDGAVRVPPVVGDGRIHLYELRTPELRDVRRMVLP